MIKLRWQVPSISATGVSEKRGWDAFHGGLIRPWPPLTAAVCRLNGEITSKVPARIRLAISNVENNVGLGPLTAATDLPAR